MRSRHSRAVGMTMPLVAMTSLGRQIAPAGSEGSSPPARPKLTSALAPASTSACAPRRAATAPMPLTLSSVPSASASIRAPAPVLGPKCRASAESAQTMPATLSMGRSVAAEAAVGRECPAGKIGAVAVILEIEHARKARRRETRIAPQALGPLRAAEIFNAALHRIGAAGARCQQRQQRPGALKGIAGGALARAGWTQIAVVALAPAAIGVLTSFEPAHGALHGLIIRSDAGLGEGHQHRPGAVDVIRPPAPEPRAVRLLLSAKKADGALHCGSVLRPAGSRQRRDHPGRDIAGRWIEQCTVIGERNVIEVV